MPSRLRDDVTFSDGTPMTIDDVIFNMYVYMDPTYDGSATFYSVPIVGIDEYRGGMDTRMNVILAAGPDGYEANDLYTEEQYNTFWAAFQTAGEKFAQSIADYVMENYGAEDFKAAVAMWGYEANDAAELWSKIVETYATISLTTASTRKLPPLPSPTSSRKRLAIPGTTTSSA